ERQRDCRSSTEVQVMPGADDSSGEIDDRRQESAFRRDARPNKFEASKEEGDDRRGEHFKESLDPQMDDPPSPIFDQRQVRVLAPRETGAVKKPNGTGRQQEKP